MEAHPPRHDLPRMLFPWLYASPSRRRSGADAALAAAVVVAARNASPCARLTPPLFGASCRQNGSLSRSTSRGSNLGGAGGSQHGDRALAKSKSMRKGLARGSLALLDQHEVVNPEDSQVTTGLQKLLCGGQGLDDAASRKNGTPSCVPLV